MVEKQMLLESLGKHKTHIYINIGRCSGPADEDTFRKSMGKRMVNLVKFKIHLFRSMNRSNQNKDLISVYQQMCP